MSTFSRRSGTSSLGRSAPIARWAWLALVCSAAFGAVATWRPAYAALLLGAAVLIALGSAARLEYVLPAALVTWVLVPSSYLPLPAYGPLIAPHSVLVILWVIRMLHVRASRHTLSFALALLALWLGFGTLDSVRPQRTLLWGLMFLLTAAAPAYVAATRLAQHPALSDRTLRSLRKTMVALSAFIGLFAVLESAAQTNPLAFLYGAAQGDGLTQDWAVYRVTTTLGHPLVNGAFLAVAVCVSLDSVLRGRYGRGAYLSLGFGLVGLILTYSRSGLLGAGAGCAFLVLYWIAQRSRRRFVHLTIFVVATPIVMRLATTLLAARSATQEAAGSVRYRNTVVDAAIDLSAQDNFLGSGAGTSQWRTFSGGYTQVMESSVLQLLISLGVPGLLLIAVLVISAVWSAVRARELAGGAALIAFAVASAGFNYWEGMFAALPMLGLLMVMSLGAAKSRNGDDEAEAINGRSQVSAQIGSSCR